MIRIDRSMIFWAHDSIVIVARESDFDDGALLVWRGDFDLVTELVAEGFRNIEAHASRFLAATRQGVAAGSTVRGRYSTVAVLAGEGFFEDAREIFRGNTETIVGDCEDSFLCGIFGGNGNSFALIFNAILKDLVDDKLEPLAIGKSFMVQVAHDKVDVTGEEKVTITSGDIFDNFGERSRLNEIIVFGVFGAGEIENLFNVTVETTELGGNFAIFIHEAQSGEGSFNFVNPHFDIVAKLVGFDLIALDDFGHGFVDSVERFVENGAVIEVRPSEGLEDEVGTVEAGNVLEEFLIKGAAAEIFGNRDSDTKKCEKDHGNNNYFGAGMESEQEK